MLAAILLGIVTGFIGFLPLVAAFRATKRNPKTGVFSPMVKLIFGLIISFAILLVATLVFIAFDKPDAMFFVLTEAIVLCITAIVFGIMNNKGQK